jgi:hypothetical protein
MENETGTEEFRAQFRKLDRSQRDCVIAAEQALFFAAQLRLSEKEKRDGDGQSLAKPGHLER